MTLPSENKQCDSLLIDNAQYTCYTLCPERGHRDPMQRAPKYLYGRTYGGLVLRTSTGTGHMLPLGT